VIAIAIGAADQRAVRGLAQLARDNIVFHAVTAADPDIIGASAAFGFQRGKVHRAARAVKPLIEQRKFALVLEQWARGLVRHGEQRQRKAGVLDRLNIRREPAVPVVQKILGGRMQQYVWVLPVLVPLHAHLQGAVTRGKDGAGFELGGVGGDFLQRLEAEQVARFFRAQTNEPGPGQPRPGYAQAQRELLGVLGFVQRGLVERVGPKPAEHLVPVLVGVRLEFVAMLDGFGILELLPLSKRILAELFTRYGPSAHATERRELFIHRAVAGAASALFAL